jgi:hypothetical protein
LGDIWPIRKVGVDNRFNDPRPAAALEANFVVNPNFYAIAYFIGADFLDNCRRSWPEGRSVTFRCSSLDARGASST